jgi:hypothetical protein
MGLYDDNSGTSSVAFAERQFKGVRQRKKAEAERQDNFNQNTLLASFAVQGAKSILNERNDNLEKNQAFARAAYRATNSNVQEYKQVNNTLRQTELSEQEYLTKKYHAMYLADFEANYEGADKASVNFVLHNLAKEQAIENAPEFKRVLDLAEEFPEYGENFDEYYNSFNKVPKNVAQFIFKTGKDAFSKETKETLEYKNNRDRDAFFGTEEMDRYTNIREAFHALDANGANVAGAMDDIRKAIEDGRIVGDLSDVKYETSASIDGNLEVTSTKPFQERTDLLTGLVEKVYLNVDPVTTSYDSLGQFGLTPTATSGNRPVSVTDINALLDDLTDEGKTEYTALMNSIRDGGSLTVSQYSTVLSDLARTPTFWKPDITTQQGQVELADKVYQVRLSGSFHQIPDGAGGVINDPMFNPRQNPGDPLTPKAKYEGALESLGITQEATFREIVSNRNWMDRMQPYTDEDRLAGDYHINNGFSDMSLMQKFEISSTGAAISDDAAAADFDLLLNQLSNTSSKFYELFQSQIQQDDDRYSAANIHNEYENGRLQGKDILLVDNKKGSEFKILLEELGLKYITNHEDYADLFLDTNLITIKYNLNARKLYFKKTPTAD